MTTRIERGATLLDEREPGWEQRIDLDRLDMSSTCDCVLGQLAPMPYGFGPMVRFLGIAGETARLGFMTWGPESYGRLTAKWRALIASRRT